MATTVPEEEPGINGAIKRVSDQMRSVNSINIPSVDESLKKVADGGGKVVMPKMTTPGVGYHAYCQDTEGVIFGLIQFDPSAR